MLKTRTFHATRKALEVYDADQPRREALWEKAATDCDVRVAEHEERVALDRVRRAFLEDTSDINTWSQVGVVDLGFMRRTAGRSS